MTEERPAEEIGCDKSVNSVGNSLVNASKIILMINDKIIKWIESRGYLIFKNNFSKTVPVVFDISGSFFSLY